MKEILLELINFIMKLNKDLIQKFRVNSKYHQYPYLLNNL